MCFSLFKFPPLQIVFFVVFIDCLGVLEGFLLLGRSFLVFTGDLVEVKLPENL